MLMIHIYDHIWDIIRKSYRIFLWILFGNHIGLSLLGREAPLTEGSFWGSFRDDIEEYLIWVMVSRNE